MRQVPMQRLHIAYAKFYIRLRVGVMQSTFTFHSSSSSSSYVAMSPTIQPRVYLDITIGGRPAGPRVVIELFTEHSPKTCEK